MCEKEFSFYFIKLSWKCFFMKEFKWKIFTNCNFFNFANENIVCLAFKLVLNKNQSVRLTTSHSA